MGNPNSKSHSTENDDLVTVKKYNGETKKGERHGRGVYLYPNGDIYDGEWRKSKKYGRGVYTCADGQRFEGFFYKDQYIGKTPNEKIKKRMEKQRKGDNVSATEITDISAESDCVQDSVVRLKSEGSYQRRVQSMRRNKSIRDKYHINASAESLDSSRKNKNEENFAESTKNMKRSFSFGAKRRKDVVHSDEMDERRNSKRLRESIRMKYNLKARNRKDLLLNSE